jgi:hypothetical protein
MPLPGNEGNFLRINKQRKSNEAIYDVGYSRISGGIRGSSEKNRPFGEKSADSVGRLHRLWARWPGDAGKSQGIAGKIWFGKSHCPDGKS